MPRGPGSSRFVVLCAALALTPVAGCHSPEDGRLRGGGHGGDGGNYLRGRVHPPSKIDGTKTWTARPKA